MSLKDLFKNKQSKSIEKEIQNIEYDTLTWFMGNEDYKNKFKDTNVICEDLVSVLLEAEQYCKHNHIKANNYQIILLGEDYLNWLEQKGYQEDTTKSRQEYGKTLSNEQRQKIWEDSGGVKNIISLFFPFMIIQPNNFGGDTNFLLSKESVDKIEDIIAKTYEKERKDIALLRYIVSAFEIEDYSKHAQQLLISKIEDNQNILFGKMETQKTNKEINLETICLCLGIRTYCNTCVFDKNWTNTLEEYYILGKSLPVNEICNIIQPELEKDEKCKDLVVLPTTNIPMFGNEIMDFHKMVIVLLEKELKKHKVKLNLV